MKRCILCGGTSTNNPTTLNYARIKCAILGLALMIIQSAIVIICIQKIQSDPTDYNVFSVLATVSVGLEISLFMIFWGIEPYTNFEWDNKKGDES
jgi:hypothetical protein